MSLCYSIFMYKQQFFILLMSGVLLTSCSKLQYFDQALVLKEYSDERDAQSVAVARQDALFEKLLDQVRLGEIVRTVKTTSQLVKQFGEPLLKKTLDIPGGREEWLYRRQIQSVSSEKVCVITEAGGAIIEFRFKE